MKVKLILFAVLAAAALASAESLAETSDVSAKTFVPKWQKGMNYVTWDSERYASADSDASLKELAATGTEWVALIITWYQEKPYTTKIYETPKTPSDGSLVHVIDYLHRLGKKVMLKPHIDIESAPAAGWRGEIACSTDIEWEAWFRNYADFVFHYAALAEAHKVDIFCIGTELSGPATTRGQMWKEKIIAPVRKIYSGPLTYAANWDGEYKYVKFWDALDYIGIDAYFPLSDKEKPDFEEIKKGWEKWVKEMEEFQATVGKPVIFPEVGYCSAQGAARRPWEEVVTGEVDLEQQKECYQALFETFWQKKWFYGMYWWRWGTDVRFGGPSNKGYSPQNKPTLDVIKRWYKKPVPHQ